MEKLSKALGLLHQSLGNLHGVPLWVFLLVLLLTSIFLLGYALKGTQVWWQLSSVCRAVRAARNGNTPPDPARVGSAFKWEPLRHLWDEYLKTLHGVHKAGTGSNALMEMHATVPAESIFNREVLVDGRLFDEFTRHLPGVLTGLGIIGTFAGLLDGLSSFRPTPIEDAVNGLGPLLLGVQHAFIASGTAIACAMVVVFVSRFALAYLYRLVERLNHGVDSLYAAAPGRRTSLGS